MGPIYDAIQSLHDLPYWQAIAWATLANVTIFGATIGAGQLLVGAFARHRTSPVPGPLTRDEILLAASCVGLNALVAVAGIVLWRHSFVHLRPYGEYSPLIALFDTAVLFLAMDFSMYVLHRIAHVRVLFPIAHQTHHVYENPRPLTLFVLNPLEVLGFGALWVLVLVVYTASVEGILAYLTLNVVFGLVGHLGVEPAPSSWLRMRLLRLVSTSTFHAEHHMDREHNYGFYLVIWDRLFGTLSPSYESDFRRAAVGLRERTVART